MHKEQNRKAAAAGTTVEPTPAKKAAKKSTGPIEFLPSYTLSPPSPWRVSTKKGMRVLEKALRRADKQSPLGIHRIVQVDS